MSHLAGDGAGHQGVVIHPSLVTTLEGRRLHVADDAPPHGGEQVRVLLLLAHSGEILPSQVEELVTGEAGVNHLALTRETETGLGLGEASGDITVLPTRKNSNMLRLFGF